MALEELVSRFTRIPGATVGRGPRHPIEPDPSSGQRVQSFLDAYPALHGDTCYVDFLKMYAGAAIDNDDAMFQVDIFGFSDASLDMVTQDGPIVEDGFLAFATCVYHRDREGKPDMYEYDFAFDVSGDRASGVYVFASTTQTMDQPPSWYVDSFCAWLEDLVNRGGVYERPPVD